MAKTNFKITFYCRESKATKKGLAPVELGITVNGKRLFINLPRQEKPSDFKRGYEDLNTYLALMRIKINEATTELMMDNKPITAYTLRDYIQTGGRKSYTIENLFEDYVSILRKRVGISISAGVCRKYEHIRDLFYSVADKHRETVTITQKDIIAFQNLIKDYRDSSKAAMLTKLKTFIKFGMDNSHIEVNPFQNIKISRGEEIVEYLTEEELLRIKNKPMPCKRLEDVKNCFLFQACSGLSYCDMAALSAEDIQEENSTYYINKNRIKTGIEYTAVILPMGVDIIKHYEGKLPVLSNQKYNSYLKEIETVCGLEKSLHSHLARKTYATMLLAKNIPYATIAKTLGHTQIKQTMHYAKVLKANLLQEVSSKF